MHANCKVPARLSLMSAARVGRAPPLFPYCRVLVNHAYRTLYLKAPKTGSTSLLTLLGTCTGSSSDKPTCFEPLKVRREIVFGAEQLMLLAITTY